MSNGIGPNPLNDISKVYLDQIVEMKKDDTYLEPDMKKRQANNEKARKELAKGPQMKNPHFEEKQQGWDAVNSLADAYKAMHEGIRDEDSEKGAAERKARLEKKRGMKLDDHPQYQKEGYGAPGHNPGSGEKSVARAKALMDKQGRKGAPGLDAMAAAKKEHEARRGVKKEEVEVEEGYDEPKMHSAVKRVMTTQPAAKGRAASRLHSKYSMRSKGNVAGETDGPGPNAPKRSGRKGRGSETDRGSGNAAKRRMSTEALDPVGKEDGDVNNDGKKDGTDKYLMNRRKAIGKAIAKKSVKEGMSNWRSDLSEVMTDEMDDKPIKEKKVNNKIKINPKLGEAIESIGGELIEATEVDEAVYGGTPAKKEAPKDTRMMVTNADKKANTPAYQKFKAGDKRYKAADHMGEEASMSDKEVRLQKQKARIDQMIAMRRKQELNKAKKSEAPAKVMGEGKGDPCWDTHKQVGMKKKGGKMVPNCVPKEEVELDERTRFAKETGKDFKTGNPSEKGGTRTGKSAFDQVSRQMRKTGGVMSSRGKAIQPQGKKKEPGKKGYKGVTPVDKIKNRLAQKRAAKPNPYRARAGESD